MKQYYFVFSTLFLSLSLSSFQFQILCQHLVPPNDLSIMPEDKNISSITETQFNQLIEGIESVYQPIVANKGGHFIIEKAWKSGNVNAYAYRTDNDWIVKIFGGLARHPLMRLDSLAMVLCHEIGHHLGGAPKGEYLDGIIDWASIEGQADYYASLKCMRLLKENNLLPAPSGEVTPELVAHQCERQFQEDSDQLSFCPSNAMASLSLANVLNSIGGDTGSTIDFSTPDTHIVDETDTEHPATQCRLDTLFAGALCPVDHHAELSDSDPTTGTCSDGLGARPRCWFAL